jgi:hypothetical protein
MGTSMDLVLSKLLGNCRFGFVCFEGNSKNDVGCQVIGKNRAKGQRRSFGGIQKEAL